MPAQDAKRSCGVVGVEIEERTYGWDAHVIEYFAVGTAIAPLDEASSREGPPMPEPTLTLSLNDPARKIVTPPPSAPGRANPTMSGGE